MHMAEYLNQGARKKRIQELSSSNEGNYSSDDAHAALGWTAHSHNNFDLLALRHGYNSV